jgi:EAL domain-containing protein (putative c-di-GMP-specific phosphodiesterase class I)
LYSETNDFIPATVPDEGVVSASANTDERARILCVDDEASVLRGLALNLKRRYHVLTATSGSAALEQLKLDPRVDVIISDMRMPGMSGAEFLKASRALAPGAERILLTGETDLASAIAAINEGQIFRFLTKPCPTAALLSTIESALDQHRARALEHSAIRREVKSRPPQIDPLAEALREALVRDEGLHLHYQPIVDVNAGRVRALECLARWQHKSLGPIPPATFIPLAEEQGEILRLGQWVLRHACRDGQQLIGKHPLEVAVNVSAKELTNKGFLLHLEKCLSESSLPPQALELELTESSLASDIERLREVLEQVRRLKVRIAVDDFGTGYSSLSYLSRLPIDVIKVDRAFVRDFHQGGKTIIKAALSIARDFGQEVIIEGVETAEMLEQVRELGASLIQGYWFAKPMPLGQVPEWLRTFEAGL